MPQSTWTGQTLGGRYQIDEMLGKGGMSAVYKATDPNLRRVVAIKLIHPHLSDNPDFVTRFKEEAAAVATLRHPNIVQVYDFNNDDDNFYMVLEFVPGETLQARLKRLNAGGRQMELMEILKYSINLCDAVDYAHKRSLVHRDIKPANIMLDVQSQAILMDFGIAKIIGGQTHTATGATIGTALYMSPEQIQGERVDSRSDIYSIGVTLFEMVSGRPPFEADSTMTTMMMHLHDPVPDLRQIQPGTSPELIAIIEKALTKNREQRFQSAAEMSAALHRILDRMHSASDGATMMSIPGIETPVPESAPTPVPEETLKAAAFAAAASAAIDIQPAAPADLPPTLKAAAPVSAPPVVEPQASVAATAEPIGMAAQPGAPIDAATVIDAPVRISPPSKPPQPPPAEDAGTLKKGGIQPAWLAGGAATILIVLALIFFGGRLFGGSGTNTEPTQTVPAAAVVAPTDAPTSTTTATQTVAPAYTATAKPSATYTVAPTNTPPPTSTPDTEPFVEITGIKEKVDANGYVTNYAIDYITKNFTESRSGYHIHFFFDTVPPQQAGTPGHGPWKLYYGPSPFTGMLGSDRPAAATKLCALVANADHSLYYPPSGQLTTGNCWAIP